MRTIRRGTFETNSSSAHTLVMFKEDDWDKFEKGEMFIRYPYSFEDAELISMENARKEIIDMLKQFKKDNDKISEEDWKKTMEYINSDSNLNKLINNSFDVEDYLGDEWEDSLDGLDLCTYNTAYGDDSEFWPDEDMYGTIYRKEGVVTVCGIYAC